MRQMFSLCRCEECVNHLGMSHNSSAPQDQLQAEITSLQTWLAECDQEGDEHNMDVVKEVRDEGHQSLIHCMTM